MGSKDSEQSAESAEQLTSPVDHDEDMSDFDTYQIKTLRSGKVVKVLNSEIKITPLKVRTMEDVLGIDESIASSHSRKFRSGGSQMKTKSLAAISSNSSHNKSQSSDSRELDAHDIEYGNSQDLSDVSSDKLELENGRSDHETTVVDGSSLKHIQQTHLIGDDDTDIEGMTLRQWMLKAKKKSSPAKSQKKGGNLTAGDSKCHLGINSDQSDNLCSSRSSKKRKCEFEDENVTTGEQIRDPREEGFPDPKQGQTLGSHKQKVPKIISSQSDQSCVQTRNENFSLESGKQQDITDLTDIENSSQDIPSSENVASSSNECKLGLANNSAEVADCRQNAVEMMELDSSPSVMHQIENEFDKQTIQKVPILVDVEPSADTLKHTGGIPLINSEAVDCNSGSKSCKLSLLSVESYCVQKHRSLSPVAKLKLFPSNGEVIRGKQMESLSIVSEPESNVIEKCTPESFHSGSVTASSVIDANPASTSPVKLLAAEVLDIEQDNCGDAFQHQPAKLPSVRKSMSPISRKRLLQAADFRSAFMKSRPPESSCQLTELDAMDARVESLDTYLKSLQSPDGKASGSPCRSKSPTLQRNSPLSLPKSPRYSPRPRFHYSPALADCLDIPSSPLLPKKTDSNDVGVQREEVSPSPSIKGILKSPGISCPTACKCDMCFSTQVRSEKASEFSQRQMVDIDTLAHTLLKELKTMRTIVEEYRTSETALSSPSSKFTVEEINQATANALEAEETTKKWINMMSRDCNRFCKIMKRPSDKRTSLSSDPQKQQKKIMFADEAGKELCHVKIFEKDENKELFFEKQNSKDKDTDESSDGYVEGNS